MKLLLCAGLAALATFSARPDVTVSSLWDPTFGNDLLVVLELTGEDGATAWEAEADEEDIAEARTGAGESLEPTFFPLSYVAPGDFDPRYEGFEKVGDGIRLLVFKFDKPKKAVESIAVFKGQYQLLSGGEERWIDAPIGEVADPSPWKDDALEGEGFELQQGVREVPQVHVKISKDVFAVGDVRLVAKKEDGSEEEVYSAGSSGDLKSTEYRFDLPEDDGVTIVVRLELDGGKVVELTELPDGEKYKKPKSDALKGAKFVVETRKVAVREFFAEGRGDHDKLRKFRWVDKKGEELDIFPHFSSGGGGTRVSMQCRIPHDLPRGARLQHGFLIGAEWNTVSFEYTDIEGPDA